MPRDRRWWNRVALISIGAGAILRVIAGLWLHPPLNYVYSDTQGYVTRATRLVEGVHLNRFDTFFPPGTHLILALPLKIFGTGRGGLWAASVLWTLLSCAVPWLAWRFSLRMMSARAAAITTALCAAWPLFIAYGIFFMSEIPSLVLLLATLILAFRVTETTGRAKLLYAVAAGIAAGASLAVRPQLVLNVLVAGVALIAAKQWRALAVAAIGATIALVPVLALNAHAAGRFVGISENGGLNFFQGHCPVRGVRTVKLGVGVLEFGSPVVAQQDRGRMYLFIGHIAWEQGYFFHQGLDCIRHDGIGHVTVLARNAADLGITSVPWPPSNEQDLRWFVKPANLVYSWALPSIIVFALAVARRRKDPATRAGLLVVHLLCVLPTAIIFYGDPRFRVPYDVFGLGLFAILVTSIRSGTNAEQASTT